MLNNEIILNGVNEYSESYDVKLLIIGPNEYTKPTTPRIVIKALNEGGYNCTQVDLLQLLDWVENNQVVLNDLIYKINNCE